MSPPHGTYESVSSTMVGTMSTSSLKTEAELTVNAARASKPGSVSTELKLRKSITLRLWLKVMDLYAVAKRRGLYYFLVRNIAISYSPAYRGLFDTSI